MAYNLYTQSYGTTNANYKVVLTETATGIPATILNSATGGLVSNQGIASLDASGNLSVYVDTAKSYTVKIVDENYRSGEQYATYSEAAAYRSGLEIVDPRDWNGFDRTGNNDNGSILQQAFDACGYRLNSNFGYGTSRRLVLPPGRIAFTTPLLIKQNGWVEGVFGAAGGTELWFAGADGDNALINTAGVALSFCHLSNFRLEDKRVNATSGRGIQFKEFCNGVSLRRMQVYGFPQEQIYIGADSGRAGDCVEIDDMWVLSTKASAKGILLERLDNNVSVRNVKSDMATTPANDGYVIRCQNFASENTVISIDSVKHESSNRCPTLSFPLTTRGNLSIKNVVQRNPAQAAAGAGDVVQFGASSAGSAFDYAWGGTITTGSASEGGGRVTLENIAGFNHSDWTGASGAATVRGLGTTQAIYGYVTRATLGANGRFVREISGNGIPNGTFYGNTGDSYVRTDAVSTTCSRWIKQQGAATNTGWAPLTPETQSVTFAATLAVNLQLGNRVQVGALTASITMSSPTNMPIQGTRVTYELTQDATGGRGVTWSALHKGAWPTASGTASQKQTVFGVSDGTNVVFQGASGWY
jgi:hypothetical protein